MKVIRPPFGPIESVTTRRAMSERQRPPHAVSRAAVETEVSRVGLKRMYAAAEAERAARVEDLKQQIKSGEYRPNLEIVAERLMGELGYGLG